MGFLETALAFPTVVFSILLAAVVGFWGLVLAGAVGFDLLDFGETPLEADTPAGAGGLLSALGFGAVPATVALSALIFWCWSTSMLGATYLGPLLGGLLPAWLASAGVLLAALPVAALCTRASVRPLRPLFAVQRAPTRRSLLGKVATVASGRVDARFGQATLEDGGAGLILPIFCGRENALKKGDQVLLLDYDPAQEAYEVEPVDWLLPEELSGLADPRRAEAVARAHLRVR